jgi:hypothetical protein
MTANAADSTGLDSLETKLASFKEALEHVANSLSHGPALPKNEDPQNLSDSLGALGDIGSLWKAHTTKLGIAFKPPIATAAAETCLHDIAKLVPLAAGVVLSMNEAKDGKLASTEASERTRALFASQLNLVEELRSVVVRQRLRSTTGQLPESRSSGSTLTCIGKVWQNCDALTDLKSAGVGGILRKRIADFSGMLDDAVEDLDGWLNGDPILDAFGDEMDGGGREGETKELAETWHKKLGRLKILYTTIAKRRTSSSDVDYMEQISKYLYDLSSLTDDLACEFMEGNDAASVKKTADDINTRVRLLIAHVKPGGDRFTEWVAQFESHF